MRRRCGRRSWPRPRPWPTRTWPPTRPWDASAPTLIPDGANVLTHCNAGALATVDWGTALGVIRTAHEQGKRLHVWVDETRPYLQGARLTAWELHAGRHPVHPDHRQHGRRTSCSSGKVDLVIVGADRVAANGDFANKIGTYGLAVLANAHGIPFYSAAPTSTVDMSIPDGEHIPIEERSAEEVTHLRGMADRAGGRAGRAPGL